DNNAQLETEFRKVASFKPLMDSYKSQLAEHEAKNTAKSKEVEGLRFELQQLGNKLKEAQEQHAKDAESLELFEDRVKELELGATPNRANFKAGQRDSVMFGGAGGLEDQLRGLGGELDDALSGTTTTDLKIRVRKLEKELEDLKGSKGKEEESRVL
ncbi:4738_t:CDS:2, partial [Acaulospora colombiana]